MEQVEEVPRRRQAQQHIHVGQAEIRVDKNDAFALFGKLQRQIDGQVGFADAALAGSDGKNQRKGIAHAGCSMQLIRKRTALSFTGYSPE